MKWKKINGRRFTWSLEGRYVAAWSYADQGYNLTRDEDTPWAKPLGLHKTLKAARAEADADKLRNPHTCRLCGRVPGHWSGCALGGRA